MMKHTQAGSALRMAILLLAAIGIAAAVVVLFFLPDPPAPPSTQPTTLPASQPATQATTRRALPPTTQWFDVVQRNVPTVTGEPLKFPLTLNEAARLEIIDPVYLCPRGDLWITRADAPPTPVALKTAANDQVHVIRDEVVYVFWHITDAGQAIAMPIVRDGDGLLRVTQSNRSKLELKRKYDWSRAFTWNDRIVAPCTDGVAVIDPMNVVEEFQSFALGNDREGASGEPRIRVILDLRGVLAWRVGGAAARYVDEKWTSLGKEQGWPERVIEAMPLLDGTATVLAATEKGGNELLSVVLETAGVDEVQIKKLVAQLSSDEAAAREAASAELSRYGSAAWPILDKLKPNQPVEAQVRLDDLLANKNSPKLGVFTPAGDDLRPVAYLPDGGAILYSDTGVEMPTAGEMKVTAPAWLAVRPGRSVRLLSQNLIADMKPEAPRLSAWSDTWLVIDPDAGIQRFLGNHIAPLLPKEYNEFVRMVGVDSRGRWLLRKLSADSPTLVVDPFIPDPTPKLPVWTLVVDNGTIGWDENDWPVQKNVGAWALKEAKWEALPEDTAVKTNLPTPATTAPADQLILKEKDGTEWYDGTTHLRRVRNGQRLDWPLPEECIGSSPAVLLRAGENRLFLFNSPGRVLRFRETDSADEPIKLEASFTENIPFTEEPQRIWCDPAGRLIIAYQDNKLGVMFPEGRMPPEIAKLIVDRD